MSAFEAPISLLSVPVGLIGAGLGIASIRAAGLRSRNGGIGIVAAVLGAYPLAVVVYLVVGTLVGWVEWR